MNISKIWRGAILLVLLSVLTACNLRGVALVAPPTATSVPATDAPVAVPATLAATETSTPTTEPAATLTPTPTLGPPTVAALAKDAVCRFGPSLDWSTEGKLPAGQSVPIQARNDRSTWWFIENPTRPGKFCWVGGDEVEATGDLAGLPVKPVPSAIVTRVSVEMEPHKASITCGTFPYTFDVSFSITTTGPVTVKFVRSKSNGDSAPAESASFDKAGTKTFSDSYKVGDIGDYWFRVRVTSPNEMTGEGSAEMECEV